MEFKYVIKGLGLNRLRLLHISAGKIINGFAGKTYKLVYLKPLNELIMIFALKRRTCAIAKA